MTNLLLNPKKFKVIVYPKLKPKKDSISRSLGFNFLRNRWLKSKDGWSTDGFIILSLRFHKRLRHTSISLMMKRSDRLIFVDIRGGFGRVTNDGSFIVVGVRWISDQMRAVMAHCRKACSAQPSQKWALEIIGSMWRNWPARGVILCWICRRFASFYVLLPTSNAAVERRFTAAALE